MFNPFYGTRYHLIKVSYGLTSAFKKAAGERGNFPSKDQCKHSTFLSYLGKQSEYSQFQPSPKVVPNEGQAEHGFCYYKNHINPIYWSKTLPHSF